MPNLPKSFGISKDCNFFITPNYQKTPSKTAEMAETLAEIPIFFKMGVTPV
jgi:hypothetical protein